MSMMWRELNTAELIQIRAAVVWVGKLMSQGFVGSAVALVAPRSAVQRKGFLSRAMLPVLVKVLEESAADFRWAAVPEACVVLSDTLYLLGQSSGGDVSVTVGPSMDELLAGVEPDAYVFPASVMNKEWQ